MGKLSGRWEPCGRKRDPPAPVPSVRGNIRRVAAAKHNPNLNYSPDRVVSAASVEDDSSFELKLRPQRLHEFIGQTKVKDNLAVAIEAARSRGEAMDLSLIHI